MGAKEDFMTRVNDLYRFEAIQGHLGWDQETIMPAKGAKARGEILAWLAGQRHGRLIDEKIKRPLSKKLLFGSLEKGGTVKIHLKNKNEIGFIFS